MGSRTWFKIYAEKWLSGSIRHESLTVRCIFIDLLALSASGQYGDTGEIKLPNEIGLTDLQISKLLNVSKSVWQKAKKRLVLANRISVNNGNIITIVNWKKYQSEYKRQKPYRNKKLQEEVTTKSYKGDRERDIGERDIGDGDNISLSPSKKPKITDDELKKRYQLDEVSLQREASEKLLKSWEQYARNK